MTLLESLRLHTCTKVDNRGLCNTQCGSLQSIIWHNVIMFGCKFSQENIIAEPEDEASNLDDRVTVH